MIAGIVDVGWSLFVAAEGKDGLVVGMNARLLIIRLSDFTTPPVLCQSRVGQKLGKLWCIA